ncbi:hypothetical protein AVEN_161559-1 [Araneus ventricosus]|uniref:Uncharacterized protein n=1 Tax=Araneus ventricosus TaxID=182803 RepID=A0A4Y2LWT1_ARAVE|nr:hypothetical protein AVEN_161559-1 [Araneus ventricosus]
MSSSVLRFSRLFGPGKPTSLPQIWRGVKRKKRKKTGEERESTNVHKVFKGLTLDIPSSPPPPEECESDDEEDLKKEHDIKCINIGSCGIHILNNAFRKGASSTEWDISSVLVALYHLFKDSPALREDFQECSKSEKMPMKFVTHRWLEISPVSLRAVEIWEDIETYVKLIRNGKLSKVTCKSCKVVEEATKDRLIKIKLLFFACVSEIIKSFLEKYRSDEPLIPFFAPDIHTLAIQCL